jgi:phosphohistidine phosphatase
MELYLIRHAHAVDEEENPARPLSERGRKQVRVLAKFLAGSGALHPAECWHSTLVRSRETAELLVRGLGLKTPLVETAGLEPMDDPAEIVRHLKGLTKPLAIVGHEPYLSTLASLLVGSAEPIFLVRKSAVIALEGAGTRWQVRWHLSPELLA